MRCCWLKLAKPGQLIWPSVRLVALSICLLYELSRIFFIAKLLDVEKKTHPFFSSDSWGICLLYCDPNCYQQKLKVHATYVMSQPVQINKINITKYVLMLFVSPKAKLIFILLTFLHPLPTNQFVSQFFAVKRGKKKNQSGEFKPSPRLVENVWTCNIVQKCCILYWLCACVHARLFLSMIAFEQKEHMFTWLRRWRSWEVYCKYRDIFLHHAS